MLGADVGESRTDGLMLEGAHTWTPTMFIRLVQVQVTPFMLNTASNYFHLFEKKKSLLLHNIHDTFSAWNKQIFKMMSFEAREVTSNRKLNTLAS